MVDHKVHYGHPVGLVTVNGHEPISVYNESTKTASYHCDTCGWVSKAYRGRAALKVDQAWRDHAGDIAMGVVIDHGQTGQPCHCAMCARADRSES